MERFGLIGEKLTHSFSKELHGYLSDYAYQLIELSKEELPDFMKKKNFSGINVTIPYKKTVIPFLDRLDLQAEKVGAVNTIVNRNGVLTGYNTDYEGFLYTVQREQLNLKGKKVLVIGNGGAASAVFEVLKHLKVGEIIIVKHHKEAGTVTYEDAAAFHNDAVLLVNTSPVGMAPDSGRSPIDITPYHSLCEVIDLIYNPQETELLRDARKRMIPAVNGLPMLVAQAFFASILFTEKTPGLSIEEVISILEKKSHP